MRIKFKGDRKKLSNENKKIVLLKSMAISKHFGLTGKEIYFDVDGYTDEFELDFSGLTRPIEVIHLAEFTDIDTLADYSCMGDCYLWRWL